MDQLIYPKILFHKILFIPNSNDLICVQKIYNFS